MKLTKATVIFFYILQDLLLYFFFDSFYHGLVVICLLEIIKQIKENNFITTYTFWQLGFLFIICFDGILSKENAYEKVGVSIYNQVGLIFLISNLIIIAVYNARRKKINYHRVDYDVKDKLHVSVKVIFLILFISFLIYEAPKAYDSFFNSRFQIIKSNEFGGYASSERSLISSVFYFLSGITGYILPSFFFIWFREFTKSYKTIILTIIPSLVIWLIYLIIGTRHHLVFSFLTLLGTYSIINRNKFKFKYSYILLILAGYFFSIAIVEARRHGVLNFITGQKIKKYENFKTAYTDNTTLYMCYVVDYFDTNDYKMGESTATILFFWVPRKIWNDKPTQFGYWFIREYLNGQKGFSDKYSAPAGYIAVPYSDFGYFGVFGISFLIGFFLNKFDIYFRKDSIINQSKRIMIISFCLASFFFLPRQLNHFYTKFAILILLLNLIFVFNKKLVVKQHKMVNKENDS